MCVYKYVRGHARSLVVLDHIGVPQGKDQVGELAPFEFGDELFVLVVGELAGVVVEDSLGRFAGGRVREHDRYHVLAKRLGNAGYLLDSHRDAVVPGTKPEIDQLTRAAFHILGSRAVVEHKERVGPRKEEAGQSQPGLDLMLRAGNHKDVRIAVHEALISCVLDKSGDEEHYVVKLASEGPPKLIQIEVDLVLFSHVAWGILVCLCVGLHTLVHVAWALCLVLHRFQLPAHDVQLRVRDGEDVAVCVS